ncbi:ATP-binding protein [Candidatus Pelagibacter sp.]|nr:ATP-binding protein [Candidatus Pelagibacter sp.]
MDISESKDFLVHTASLKEVRTFSRDVFDKLNLNNDLKDELVLAIAEAAQNVVKHAYKGVEDTSDHMQIKISLTGDQLEIGFYDKGKPVVAENIQHRKLDDIKPGGLGTYFIKQIMDDAVFKKDQQQWVNHLVLTKKI